MIGIYKIENKVNGKVYIGQSIDIDTRWKQHINELDSKGHINKHLQYAWNKYGSDSFEFSIVEILPNLDLIDEREQYWIEYYKAFYKDSGYNMTRGGKGTQQISHEDIDKIYKLHNSPSNVYTPKEIGEIIGYDQKTIRRILHNGNLFNKCDYNPEEGSWISIICLNTNEVFKSIDEAEKAYNINGISAVCKRKHKYVTDADGNQLMWMYYKDYLKKSQEEIESYIANIKYSLKLYSVVCLNNLQEYDSAAIAATYCNLKTGSSINQCCCGKNAYAGKGDNGELLVWRYKKDFDKMSNEDIELALNNARIQCRKAVICLNNSIIFDDTFEASSWCKCGREIIKNCCRNTAHFAGNHPETNERLTWSYLDDYYNMTKEEINHKLFLTKFYKTNPEKQKEIICLNTLEVFDSMKDCAIWCNLKNPSMIGYNLRQNKSIGRHPETKQKLYWMYYEDYLKSTPEYIDSIIPVEESGIICVETQKIFGLIKDAKDFCGLRTQDGIVACCKGEAITSGGYHWKYYKDYLKEIA